MPAPDTAGVRSRASEWDGLSIAMARIASAIQPMGDDARNALGSRAGVPRSVIDHASLSGQANPEAHFGLCIALGIDPLNGEQRERGSRPVMIRWDMLGVALGLKRAELKLNIRDAAKAAGFSKATISRAENRTPMSLRLFVGLCDWARADPWSFIQTRPHDVPPYREPGNGRRRHVSRVKRGNTLKRQGKAA